MAVRLSLRLDGHCVEAASRREFKRLMDLFFEEYPEDPQIADKLELLRVFLEKTDFPRLRGSDPRLSGERPFSVTLARDGDSEPFIEKIE